MTCKERLTIKYGWYFVPKECCTVDRNGNADDCDGCKEICDSVCNEHPDAADACRDCPIQKCFNRLGELEDKLENGTILELPCKVGDKTIKVEDGEIVITSPSKRWLI